MIRLPDGMRERIRDAAEKTGRSMNAEIVARIESTFQMDELFGEPSPALTDIKAVLDAESAARAEMQEMIDAIAEQMGVKLKPRPADPE